MAIRQHPNNPIAAQHLVKVAEENKPRIASQPLPKLAHFITYLEGEATVRFYLPFRSNFVRRCWSNAKLSSASGGLCRAGINESSRLTTLLRSPYLLYPGYMCIEAHRSARSKPQRHTPQPGSWRAKQPLFAPHHTSSGSLRRSMKYHSQTGSRSFSEWRQQNARLRASREDGSAFGAEYRLRARMDSAERGCWRR